MPREQVKTDYTEDEIKNLESGKCFCGKPRSEFEKGMRVYCSKSHRSDWYLRTVTWKSFKDSILKKQGKKCVKCGCTPESLEKNNDLEYEDWIKKVKANKEAMKIIQLKRIDELKEIEEKYQKIMNDDYLIKCIFNYRRTNEMPKGLKKAPGKDHWTETIFEVDHILAVSLGGEMWDESNLQVLCYKDHKLKTKSDMVKLRTKRKQEKNQTLEVVL